MSLQHRCFDVNIAKFLKGTWGQSNILHLKWSFFIIKKVAPNQNFTINTKM